jgi:hypothetical protein
MRYFEDIARVIAENAAALRATGALAARPGRTLGADGYPTGRRVIVLEFATASRPADIPRKLGAFPVEARTLPSDRPRPQEYVPSAFPGRVAFVEGTDNGGSAAAAKPTLPYTPPSGANLDPLPTTNVKMICSVSPDNGWRVLEPFLTGTQNALTVAMYDWTSAHIEQSVATALTGKSFELVLDNPTKDRTADQSDEQTVQLLKTALAATFEQQWALTPRDPAGGTPIFESAYHIKVAVRDTGTANSALWLSSGNWNNSNQPVFDPNAPDLSLAKSSDRDWHIVVFNDALATTFKAYIDHDFSVAKAQNAAAAGAAALPEAQALASAATTDAFTTFALEMTVEGETTITPLLTPDPGIYVDRITALIDAAKTSFDLQFQYITSFTETGDEAFAGIVEALARAQARGVAMRMIFSEFQEESILELLAEAKLAVDHGHVRIQNNVHNKGMLVDGQITVVSSQNWSGAGVLRNRDAGLIVDNAEVNAYYLARFNYDWETLATGKPTTSKGGSTGGADGD